MERNFNYLDKSRYLINSNLQKELFEARYVSKRRILEKDMPGTYVINFRVLNENKKTLVYNYVYYRSDLSESIILYLLLRNYHPNTNMFEGARRIGFTVR